MADRGSTTDTPHWVKVLGIITLILLLLVVVVMLVDGGSHGSGRHAFGGQPLVKERWQ